MSIVHILIDQHRRARGPRFLAPVEVAQIQLQRGNTAGALQTLRASYAPAVVVETWRALRGEDVVVPAGQVADGPRITGLSTFGTVLLGGLVVAGLWWAVR